MYVSNFQCESAAASNSRSTRAWVDTCKLMPAFAPTHNSCPVYAFQACRILRTSRKRPRAAIATQHALPPDDSGNADVQDKLMNIIRVQIGQEKVKDFVKEESEKLRQAAEEVSSIPA